MTINEKALRWEYVAGDFLMANLSWLLLNVYRYELIAHRGFESLWSFFAFYREVQLQLFIPLFWLVIYYYSGYYNNPIHRDRLQEFRQTFISCAIGTLIIFFLAIMNDLPSYYRQFYKLLIASFFFQFSLTYLFRFGLTQGIMRLVHRRKFGFNTLIIGVGNRAANLDKELENLPIGVGYLIKGFIDTGQDVAVVGKDKILGRVDDIGRIIEELKIKEILVAPDSRDEKQLFGILKGLYKYNVSIKVLAGKYSILSRAVRMTGVFTSPMIEITRDNMPEGQKNIKKTFDFAVSLFCLILLSPLFAYLTWRIKKDSPGPVLYKQERIGYLGRPFTILKFRTMSQNAEQIGIPQLSSEDDNRITPFGRIMRKYRLDEFPQFWNILKGEMSLVGPRPERKYFVDRIIKEAPYYCLIYNIKPGLTSWATVKNGYANTMEKMIDRLKYDIIYLESRTLAVDFKILFYTVKTIFTGEGM